jgi:hypothetical protein
MDRQLQVQARKSPDWQGDSGMETAGCGASLQP